MGEKSTRREFLKTAVIAGAGAACPGVLSTPLEAAQEKSRLVVVRNPAALSNSDDSPGGKLDRKVLGEMLDKGVAKLTRKDRGADGWKELFKPTEVVGIKVNCLFGKGASTHPEVAYEVAEKLITAGVKPQNIIIWDRATGDLLKSGFSIRKEPDSFQVLANDGVWEDEPAKLGSFNGRLTKIVTQQITAMINIPIMKDHGISGVSGALKNHYGTFDNPGKHHGNNCDPYLADLNAIPAIRDKTRLIILDAFRPMADGGPSLNTRALWDYHSLVFSQDPVAIDHYAWTAIDARRKETGLPLLAEAGRPPKWIKSAAKLGLGVDDPAQMEVIRIT